MIKWHSHERKKSRAQNLDSAFKNILLERDGQHWPLTHQNGLEGKKAEKD